MNRTIVATACLATALLAAPQAGAAPVNVFNFPLPTAPAFPIGVPPGPPSIALPPVTVTGVTLDDTLGFVAVGTGHCAPNVGMGCSVPVPNFNPFLMAPTMAFECFLTGAAGPWPAPPSFYLAQDDGDGVLGGPADAIIGPVTFGPGGDFLFPFGPAFFAGAPIQVIPTHPGVPVTPLSATLSITVSCFVI